MLYDWVAFSFEVRTSITNIKFFNHQNKTRYREVRFFHCVFCGLVFIPYRPAWIYFEESLNSIRNNFG